MDSTPPTHLPRYRRLATKVNLVLTERDFIILRLVESFRLLTSEHIQALAPGSNQGILRRLQKLFHAGYLDRLLPHITRNGGGHKMIYAVTNKGAQVLQKEGVIQELSKTDRNAQNRDLHDLSVRHRLLISHVRTILTAACKTRADLELLSWREGRDLQDRVEVTLSDRHATLPVAPDGLFTLRSAQGRSTFLIEADRGTMTVKRFTLKVKAYAAYCKDGKHEAKFGGESFRVLTVTSSATRCKNLIEAVSAAEDVRGYARMFFFTSEEQLELAYPEAIFEKIWTSVAEDEPCSIL